MQKGNRQSFPPIASNKLEFIGSEFYEECGAAIVIKGYVELTRWEAHRNQSDQR